MQRYAVHAKIYLRASPEKNNRDQFLKYSGKKLEIIAVTWFELAWEKNKGHLVKLVK